MWTNIDAIHERRNLCIYGPYLVANSRHALVIDTATSD